MLSQYVRCIYSDDGTLTDYSLESQDRTDVIPFEVVAAEDYFYVGQYFPFNNLYFNVDTANSNASVVSVDYWDGSSWVSAVDVIDATKSSGASMAQSGVVQWEMNRDSTSWGRLSDSSDEGSDLGFNTLTIYDLYWVRISFSADFSASTDLKQITYKFCQDADMEALAPDIDDYLTSWTSGKTDWNEQIIEASRQLVTTLKNRGLIHHPGQILRFDDVTVPCAYKTLALIYDGLGGEDFQIMRDQKNNKFYSLLSKVSIGLDTNKNARVDQEELVVNHGSVYR